MDVLVYLANHRDRIVSVDELLTTLWQDRVVQESAIHARINQLRTALNDSAKNPRYIKTVIKRGYQAIAEVSIPQSSSVLAITNSSPSRWRGIRPLLAGAFTLSLAVLLIAAYLLTTSGTDQTLGEMLPGDDASIAVLPFSNLSASEETGFFAAGIHDDLLSSLSENPELKVISRTSVMRYSGTEDSVKEIGRDLSVNYIVEGSVRRQGGEVRISVQLIDTRTDEHIWAATYDRELADVFVIQSEITAEVANRLSVAILDQSPVRYEPDVNDVLFQVRPLLQTRSSESLDLALSTLRALREEHEGNAEVHAAIARTLWLQSLTNRNWDDVRVELNQSLNLALELNPELTSALLIRASVLTFRSDQKLLAEDYYQRAINSTPNSAEALMRYGSFLAITRRQYDLGFYFLRQAVEIDPYSGDAWGLLANAYVSAGDLDGSYGVILEGLERVPESAVLLQRQVQYFLFRGARVQGVQSLLAQIRRDPQALPNIGLLIDLLSRMGLHEAAGLWLEEMQSTNPNYPRTFRAEYDYLWYKNDWDVLAGLMARWEPVLDVSGSPGPRHSYLWALQADADELMRAGERTEARLLYTRIANRLVDEADLPNRIEGAGGEVIELLWLGNMLAHALIATDRNEEARDLLTSIVQNSGGGGDVEINRVLAYAMLGEDDAAIAAFRNVVSGPPAGEFGVRLFMDPNADWFNDINRDPEVMRLYDDYLTAREERKNRLRVESPEVFSPADLLRPSRP